MLLGALVAGAIGVWAGFDGWQSGTPTMRVYAAVAVLTGGNLLFCSWLWWRAKPDSADAMVLPTLLLLSGGMLIGIVPRLFWPSAGGIHVAGSIASAVVVIAITVVQIRRRRRLRDQARPA
jgi:hypothetical protein